MTSMELLVPVGFTIIQMPGSTSGLRDGILKGEMGRNYCIVIYLVAINESDDAKCSIQTIARKAKISFGLATKAFAYYSVGYIYIPRIQKWHRHKKSGDGYPSFLPEKTLGSTWIFELVEYYLDVVESRDDHVNAVFVEEVHARRERN